MRLLLKVTLLLVAYHCYSQNSSLKVHYAFDKINASDSIADASGNGYTAFLKNGAEVINLENHNILFTGSENGYLDMGSRLGEVISILDDFTISTYLYIDPSTDLSESGNFIWSFSNVEDILTNPEGCMFLSAKNTRYAISPTNWRDEQEVGDNTESLKGEWLHYLYVQSGSVGTLYINGVSTASESGISMLPSDLDTTAFNYLAKSCYSQDIYLKNTMYYDFRIYNMAVSTDTITKLSSEKSSLDTLIFNYLAQKEIDSIEFYNTCGVTDNIDLPQSDNENVTITWQSSDETIISNTGIVSRPEYNSDTAVVIMTVTATCNFVSISKTFQFKVIPQYSDEVSVNLDLDGLIIEGNLNNLREDLQLPITGFEGSIITWESDKSESLNIHGVIINRPCHGDGKLKVSLTATVSKGTISKTKIFNIYLAEDEGYSGYLFVYFTGNYGTQEAIRFALSDDGITYKALNNNEPVLSSDSISRTGGVRDPHILRGADSNFYMVATDMVAANGWSSNTGIVLLKSSDLINWTSSTIDIPEAYPETFGQANRVWAPETIYDTLTGKYMIYFSINNEDDTPDKFYYAYADTSFIGFENEPQELFSQEYAVIDANIITKDSLYYLFYKTEGSGSGIKKATSKNLTGPYTALDGYLQSTSNSVEGECVFRFTNTDTYCLIYDVYNNGYYEFTQSTDLENFTLIDSVSMDFSPRHGTIIPVTAGEMELLKLDSVKYIGATPILFPDTTITLPDSTDTLPDSTTVLLRTEFNQKSKITIKKIVVSSDGFFFNSDGDGMVDVFNMQGVKVESTEIKTGRNYISVRSGIYIIRLTAFNQIE